MRLLAVTASVSALATAPVAHAYCQTTTCDPDRHSCARDAEGCVVEGRPLRWVEHDVQVALDARSAADAGFDPGLVAALLAEAIDTWQGAACEGGATPRLRLSPAADCSPDAADVAVRFVPARDPETEPAVLAASDVDFDGDGALKRVEIRVLAGPRWLTTGDEVVEFDLLSTLIHELGHAVGMSHSSVAEAVMLGDPRPGQLVARALSEDDRAAICAIYAPADEIPPASVSARTEPLFARCASDAAPPEALGCAVRGSDRRSAHGPLSMSVFALLWTYRRAARRSRSSPRKARRPPC